MTVEEFSNQFDTLVSSYRRFRDFDNKENLDTVEFNEYEKSLYLTKAQEEIVLALYTGRNSFGQSFEETEELRRNLSNLVKEAQLEPIKSSTGIPLGIDSRSTFFTLPEDVWYITYEAVDLEDIICQAFSPMDVYPVTQDDYHKTKRNPFRGVGDRRALRLDLSDGVIEIICKYAVKDYYLRYLRRPKPIILVNLPNKLTIEGESKKIECELHSSLHQQILEKAVIEALQNKLGSSRSNNENNNRNR